MTTCRTRGPGRGQPACQIQGDDTAQRPAEQRHVAVRPEVPQRPGVLGGQRRQAPDRFPVAVEARCLDPVHRPVRAEQLGQLEVGVRRARAGVHAEQRRGGAVRVERYHQFGVDRHVGLPGVLPTVSSTTADTARTVPLPYRVRTLSLMPNPLLIRLTTRIACSELPPTSKKLLDTHHPGQGEHGTEDAGHGLLGRRTELVFAVLVGPGRHRVARRRAVHPAAVHPTAVHPAEVLQPQVDGPPGQVAAAADDPTRPERVVDERRRAELGPVEVALRRVAPDQQLAGHAAGQQVHRAVHHVDLPAGGEQLLGLRAGHDRELREPQARIGRRGADVGTAGSAAAAAGWAGRGSGAPASFVQNLRRGHHELATDAPPQLRPSPSSPPPSVQCPLDFTMAGRPQCNSAVGHQSCTVRCANVT